MNRISRGRNLRGAVTIVPDSLHRLIKRAEQGPRNRNVERNLKLKRAHETPVATVITCNSLEAIDRTCVAVYPSCIMEHHQDRAKHSSDLGLF